MSEIKEQQSQSQSQLQSQSLKRVLSIQSHVVQGYVGNKCATFPLQVSCKLSIYVAIID